MRKVLRKAMDFNTRIEIFQRMTEHTGLTNIEGDKSHTQNSIREWNIEQ